jgi:hypothetical protein
MTELQRAVLADLLLHGPSTAKEIGERIGRKWRAVQQSLCWLRGNGWVDDGSTVVGAGHGFAWSPGPKPARWAFSFEPSPGNVVYHGLSIPRAPW